MRLYKNGNVLIGEELKQTQILTDKGKILRIDDRISAGPDCTVEDLHGKFVLPALIDIHTHGANGFDFNTATTDQMHEIMRFYVSKGVGGVLPTVMTDDEQNMRRQLYRIAQLAPLYNEIKGIHLEGPFLSEAYCGAMPKQYLRKADVEMFRRLQDSACGLIKLVTIAPEVEGSEAFIREVAKSDIKVSLGHSGADYEQTMRCVKEGAVSFTHTFNAMKPIDRHLPNILGAALASDCYCEVICDGKHVHPANVKLLAKVKGADRVIAVTDSMMATGMGDGRFTLGGQEVVVKNGDATIAETGTRAGSTLTADECFTNAIEFTELPLAKAIKLMTENPAKMLGIFDSCGSIEVDKDADFLIIG
ncbi:MAG: N-acetylglucosamine-6-phosphate deacetylase [Corallococcus sp.]|nr:N-acetylglucosamine-6-phosphate deacetylase [Corallococcus sp.]